LEQKQTIYKQQRGTNFIEQIETMTKLKSIEVLFFAKLIGLVMSVAGFICGILYSFGGFFYELFSNNLNLGTALAFLALIGMPLIFSAAGFVAGGVGAILYNITARFTGGIKSGFKTS